MPLLSRTALLASVLVQTVAALPTITSYGAKLFTSNGNQFFVKGVAYQGSPSDPLVDVTQCTNDVNLMKTLGINSIRVYHVDPQQNHDGCMQVLSAAGIYVWLDLDTFTTYILQDTPYWNSNQYSNYAKVMDTFVGYDNLAGFWIGNEVINTASGSGAAPYIKAAVADMKSYRDSKNYRKVPIGYSAADIAELRPMLQDYLACGSDASQTIDFFGLNSYEWCGTNTFNGSGYNVLQDEALNYGSPIFFSETGCNVGGPRTFDDQAAILGPDMDGTWSGAMIYEWVEETNNYGLVSYAGGLLTGTPIPIQPDFSNLANRWKTLMPTGISSAAYTPSISAPVCPSSTAGGWLVNGSPPLPTLGVKAVTAIQSTAAGAAPATVAAVAVSTTGTPAPPTTSTSSSTSAVLIPPTSTSAPPVSTRTVPAMSDPTSQLQASSSVAPLPATSQPPSSNSMNSLPSSMSTSTSNSVAASPMTSLATSTSAAAAVASAVTSAPAASSSSVSSATSVAAGPRWALLAFFAAGIHYIW